MTAAGDKRESRWWFECWFSEGSNHLPYYMLYVSPAMDAVGGVVVIDPQKESEITFRAADYSQVVQYLSEDGFLLVEGRMHETDPTTIGALDYDLRRISEGLEPVTRT
jgi:hypothetical protein